MNSSNNPAQSPGERLKEHAARLADTRTRDLFDAEPGRYETLSFALEGLFIDFSKNLVDPEVLDTLFDLASTSCVEDWRDKMVRGEIVNVSENRPALHVALRDPKGAALHVDGVDVRNAVSHGLEHMSHIVGTLRNKEWLGASEQAITDVVHIGIGGSILGPVTAVHALGRGRETNLNVHFVSNVDASSLMPLLQTLNPETTLFTVVSKSFTTLETLTNGTTAKDWLLRSVPAEMLSRHLIAVTARPDRAEQFGVASNNVLQFWDWVGGRFSLWSAVGLPIALSIGMDQFMRLLDGARQMDEHFQTAPLDQNIPVLLALIGIWNTNYQKISAHAVLPYDDRLDRLPAHLQQLEMESTGKSVDVQGHPLTWKTSPVVFGMAGTDSQHTFFQAVHQGTHAVSADFIGCLKNDHGGGVHHEQLLANMFAQSEALMVGWSAPDEEGHEERVCPGNRPSTTILLDSLNPENLGMLLAMYEHKVFVQGIIWRINPFDQWGVELGKRLTDSILETMSEELESTGRDPSTNGLIDRFMKAQRDSS